MTKKLYFDIQIKPRGGRMAYSVPAKGSREDIAIKKACITGLIGEGDCELIDGATEITKEQYDHMLGTDRVKQEIIRFHETENEAKRIVKGKMIVHEEWGMEIDVRANSMSEAKRLAWKEVYNRTRDTNYPKKKVRIDDCDNLGEHMFRCYSKRKHNRN